MTDKTDYDRIYLALTNSKCIGLAMRIIINNNFVSLIVKYNSYISTYSNPLG
jgi:hypothetical protein